MFGNIKAVLNTSLAPEEGMPFKEAAKQLLSIAVPIMGASFLQLAYNTADIFWVGRLGSDAVASVGTAGFYMNLAWSLTNLITVGAGVKLSQAIGAKDFSKARSIVRTGLTGILLLIIAIAASTIFFRSELISFFDLNKQSVIQGAEHYLWIVAIGFFFSFQNYYFTVLHNSSGKSKISLRANSIGLIANIILDPILIFGLDMGITGAAVATVISQSFTSFYYYYIISKDETLNPKLASYQKDLMSSILRVSAPIAAQRILFTAIAIIMGKIVAKFGVDAVAAQRVGFQIESLSFIMIMSFHQGLSTFSGNALGAKQVGAVFTGYKAGISLGLIYSAIVTTILIVFSKDLMGLFVENPNTIEAGQFYLIIIGASSMFATLEMVTAGAFNGLGLTRYPATNSIILTSMRIPVAIYLSSTSLGLNGVWLSISVSSILKGLVMVILYQVVLKKFIRTKRENYAD